jgi:hypothetical protein
VLRRLAVAERARLVDLRLQHPQQARQGGRAQVAQRVAGQLMHGFLRVAGRGQGFG